MSRTFFHLEVEVPSLDPDGGLCNAVSLPSGEWGEDPVANDCCACWGYRNNAAGN